MNQVPNQCPICGGEMVVTRLHCRACDTRLEGRFTYRAFAQLTDEQMRFVEVFVRCEGKLNRMSQELNLSYPTLRNRLREIIRAMGYEPEETGDEEEAQEAQTSFRQQVLDDLEQGKITPDEALRLLQKGGR